MHPTEHRCRRSVSFSSPVSCRSPFPRSGPLSLSPSRCLKLTKLCSHLKAFADKAPPGIVSPLSLTWLGPSQASGLSFRATFAKRAFLSTQLERGHFLFSFSAPYYFTALVLIGIYFIPTPSSLIRLLSSTKAFPRLFLFYI